MRVASEVLRSVHPWPLTETFPYAKNQRCPQKLAKTETAYSLLNSAAIAFVPTKLGRGRQKEEEEMLWTIFVILLVLWLLGVVSSYTVGGFIHILLVLALVVLLINIIGGRRTVV
jgi:hypothetical protein